jgi:hypothetical protein
MDISFKSDQFAIPDTLDSHAKPYLDVPISDHTCALVGAQLDRKLTKGGFPLPSRRRWARWCGHCWAGGGAMRWLRRTRCGVADEE